ncbi:pentapeptide repeat-containing protein [Ancylothrix sp. C2]|uniref:pentapeptide repeat-containing protein n=1 Tax=Ancylothrix sp. D3o TaxID=2953691 RepID=UPI0021BAB1C1|nr:pentapeptide repeat-containing protein [Ancylothrix sp. D3o]MCT7950178.1 pentapeptide repeat-containing protein [Ancylothrix sp. D3o]
MLQDFSLQNLQGRNFKGQDLSGCNFAGADIRGANFTGAVLKGANFSNILAGVQPSKGVLLRLLSCFLSVLAGAYSVFSGVAINPNFTTLSGIYQGVILLFLFGIFGGFTFYKNLEWGVLSLAVLSSLVGAMGTATWNENLGLIWAFSSMVVWVWLRILAGVFALACGGEGGGAAAGFLAWLFGFFAMIYGLWIMGISDFLFLIWGLIIYLVVGVFSGYGCRRAIRGDLRFNLVLKLGVILASTVGTCFRRADLTDANFSKAVLDNVDFRQAILTRTYLRESSFIFRARLEGTILENDLIRDLLVTGNGRNKCYSGLSLKGANLAGANLENADLQEVNLNEATLKKACLNGSNLRGTQLLGVNLSEAKLTAAVLADLNVNYLTNVDGVICDYFYFQADQLERLPKSGEFLPGEFDCAFEEVCLGKKSLFNTKEVEVKNK